ncbi:hypothetical protein K1W54_04845 [Micromonospora sp. CPCC 205371]|nr:hypothetical protein [Micromonospora sp. CPCC 205371]
MTRNPRRRLVKALAVATSAAVLATLAGCSTRPPADEVYLFYMDGSVDTKEFKECVEPNGKGPWQANNNVYTLPTSLRTWNIRPTGGDTDQPIKSSSKPGPDGQPGPEVVVYATAEFYLNTNCDGGVGSPVVQFWEKTGRRYKVSDGDGTFNEGAWRTMLLNTLVPAEEKAIREATRNYTADALDANANGVWKQMEEALGATFLTELKAKTGGDYFCGPTYDRSKKECPPIRISITDVNFADQGIAEARARVFKAEQDAKAALIAAQSQVDVANKLSQAGRDAGYVRLKELETQLESAKACAANPNCTLIVGGTAGVNVTTK